MKVEGVIQKRDRTQKGKPYIVINGTTYYAGKTDIGGLQAGDRVEFESVNFAKDGGEAWGVNEGWKLLAPASKYPPAGAGASAPGVSPTQREIAAPASSGAVVDAERPAISNWIAAAITAGVIKDPADLGIWVNCAKRALRDDMGTDKDIP
jgi:hypothetical protein